MPNPTLTEICGTALQKGDQFYDSKDIGTTLGQPFRVTRADWRPNGELRVDYSSANGTTPVFQFCADDRVWRLCDA